MSTTEANGVANPDQFKRALKRRLTATAAKGEEETRDAGAAISAEDYLQEIKETVPQGSGCIPVRNVLAGRAAMDVLKEMAEAKLDNFPKTRDVLVAAVMEGFCAKFYDDGETHEPEFGEFIGRHFVEWRKEDRQKMLTRLREAMQDIHPNDASRKAAQYIQTAGVRNDAEMFRAMARTAAQHTDIHRLIFATSLMRAMPGRTTPGDVELVISPLCKVVEQALYNAEAASELHARLLHDFSTINLAFEEVDLAVFTWRAWQDQDNAAAKEMMESQMRAAASEIAHWMSRNTSTPFRVRLDYEYLKGVDGPPIEGSRKTFMTI